MLAITEQQNNCLHLEIKSDKDWKFNYAVQPHSPLLVCLHTLSLSQLTQCCSLHLSMTLQSSSGNLSPGRKQKHLWLKLWLHYPLWILIWNRLTTNERYTTADLEQELKAFLVWGWRLQEWDCHIKYFLAALVIFWLVMTDSTDIWNYSYLKWMRHSQTDHPRA